MRARSGGPRCEATTEEFGKYPHRCYQAPVPGTRRCHVHGERPARLITKDGPRRGFVELSCRHLAMRVTFDTTPTAVADWSREVLRKTYPHKCFGDIRKRYGVKR